MGPLAIPLESIESVQLKKPTMTHSNGHIRIVTPNGNEPAELTLYQATSDDKTIMVLLGKNSSARSLAVDGSDYCSFDGSHVTLQRFVRFGNVMSSVKWIPLDSITVVQIISPRGVIPGTIRFTVPGTSDRTFQYEGTTLLHNDENAIRFIPSQKASFIALRSAIEAAQSAPQAHSGAPSSNVLDQIAQLAGLRDSGIVRPEDSRGRTHLWQI